MQGTQEGEEHGSCSGNCMREMDLIWDDIWCSLTGGNVGAGRPAVSRRVFGASALHSWVFHLRRKR
jgi:hypothetical protein